MRCSVYGCNSHKNSKNNPFPNVNFFSFPKDPVLHKKWLHLAKRKDKVNLKYAVVYSKHFCDSDYKVNLKHTLLNYTPENYRGLKVDAIPSQNLYDAPAVVSASVSVPSKSGEKRKLVYKKRERAQLVKQILDTTET